MHKNNLSRLADLKAFLSTIRSRYREGRFSFSWIATFTFDRYLTTLSDKQGESSITFWCFLYDTTRDRTLLSCVIGEHLKYYANEPVKNVI